MILSRCTYRAARPVSALLLQHSRVVGSHAVAACAHPRASPARSPLSLSSSRAISTKSSQYDEERIIGTGINPPSLWERFYQYFPIQLVREREQWVVERFGKYKDTLMPGLNFIVPLLDRVAYKHVLKVRMVEMNGQLGISKDNVELAIDGVLYWQVNDAFKASYNIEHVAHAVSQLAVGIMRAELGKLEMERIFEERTELNELIMSAINESCANWGVVVLRYEVCDIKLPMAVKEAMQLQTIAERRKREQVIGSQGERLEMENIAEGDKFRHVKESEAERIKTENIARGEAVATVMRAAAQAVALRKIGETLRTPEGRAAAQLRVASKYVDAFEKLAKRSNTVLLPANAGDARGMVAQAMAIFKQGGDKSFHATEDDDEYHDEGEDDGYGQSGDEGERLSGLEELDRAEREMNDYLQEYTEEEIREAQRTPPSGEAGKV